MPYSNELHWTPLLTWALEFGKVFSKRETEQKTKEGRQILSNLSRAVAPVGITRRFLCESTAELLSKCPIS